MRNVEKLNFLNWMIYNYEINSYYSVELYILLRQGEEQCEKAMLIDRRLSVEIHISLEHIFNKTLNVK